MIVTTITADIVVSNSIVQVLIHVKDKNHYPTSVLSACFNTWLMTCCGVKSITWHCLRSRSRRNRRW